MCVLRMGRNVHIGIWWPQKRPTVGTECSPKIQAPIQRSHLVKDIPSATWMGPVTELYIQI